MTNLTANCVYPVIEHGLRIRDVLTRGEALSFEREHTRLREMLLDPGPSNAMLGPRPGDRIATGEFLGIRYALVCWLDELIITGTAWRDQWNERKLEVELYGSNDRAWKFWDQARLAEQQPQQDALEVYFLCVQLGFRGILLEDRDKLREWANQTRAVLRELPVVESPYDLQPPPAFAAPPRRGWSALQRMVLIWGIVALIFIPVMAFLLVANLDLIGGGG